MIVRENWQGMAGPLGKIHTLFSAHGAAEIRPTDTAFEAIVYVGQYRLKRPMFTKVGDDLGSLMVWCEDGLAKIAP